MSDMRRSCNLTGLRSPSYCWIGWMLAEPSLLYRRWRGNTTPDRDTRLATEDSPSHRVMVGRLRALRDCGGRWAPGSATT